MLLGFTLAFCSTKAQFSDNFSDGDFTANPAWIGSTADFIINAEGQLQSNSTVASTSFYLSTPSTLATEAEWEFYTRLAFSTSGSNYVDVYLVSASSDLLSTSNTGYFVRIGNTADEISLYKKQGSTETKIIDGADGLLGSNNTLKIKVTRNSANLFTLWRDLSGTGNSYAVEGTVTDADITGSAYFGVLVKQSTSSFFQKHFFDDFSVTAYVPDITPPAIVSVTSSGTTGVDVLFNEPVDATTAQNISNYSVSNGIGNPATATIDAANPALVHLSFANPYPANTNLTITITGIQDLSGNTAGTLTGNFSYFTAGMYSVVIDEIMADPTPLVGLPDAEFVELRNTTEFDINLAGWKLGKGSSLSGALPSYVLKADSVVIITGTSNLSALQAFGPALSVTSFPALSNDGDNIFLQSDAGNQIHNVNYSSTWYKNALKANGGWSLEMIDPHSPCAGSENWAASEDPSGGTPGRINSINGTLTDTEAPTALYSFASDDTHIVLVFNEPVDITTSSVTTNYTISNGIGNPASAQVASQANNQVILTLASPLQQSAIYTVTVNNISDCKGNAIAANTVFNTGLPGNLDSLDLVVNEILFNPVSYGYDYVEIFNRSQKVINLKGLYLANRNTANEISSVYQVTTTDRLLFPGEYIVFTENIDDIKSKFIAQNPSQFIQMSSLPSYGDDDGFVILLNAQGEIVDEVHYNKNWHSGLLSIRDGVSLERLDPNGNSNDPNNWHSASTNSGFGTPTYKNSQGIVDINSDSEFSVAPKIFSPDNDGHDDFAVISYNFPAAGSIANITIFDAAGRPVRYLQKSALNGTSGSYRWDGLGEKQQKLPAGMYIVFAEVFNLQGKTKQYKKVVVLARR